MKFLVNAFGTAGDVNPFLAIGRTLATLGHEVTLALNPACEAAAATTGLRFVPVGPRWDVDEVTGLERYLDPNKGGINVWKEICLPNIVPTHEALSELIAHDRPDAVVAHFLCVGAHWAARKAGVKYALGTLAPCWWVSKQIPPIFAPQRPPRWLHPSVVWIAKAAINLSISRPLAPICAQLGRPFRKDEYFRVFAEADLNLGLWSPSLRPPAMDDPPRAHLCGFPFSGTDAALPALEPRLEAFLSRGDPPVVVGLGTSVRNLGAQIFPEAARACLEAGHRVVLIGTELPGLPERAFSLRAAPYSAVFPRALAIVHHGGVGTTAEAMKAGKPTVIVPFASDQHDNALLAERAGVSVTLARRDLTAKGLGTALRRLLGSSDHAANAASLGEQIRAEGDGAVVAAKRVVEFAAG